MRRVTPRRTARQECLGVALPGGGGRGDSPGRTAQAGIQLGDPDFATAQDTIEIHPRG
ncbi:MAG: hypothetical protein HOY75_47765 [Streptomyces sp.]|nr:hypothetical protein [Streptomyces sp.]